jgi:hypothetical protein
VGKLLADKVSAVYNSLLALKNTMPAFKLFNKAILFLCIGLLIPRAFGLYHKDPSFLTEISATSLSFSCSDASSL